MVVVDNGSADGTRDRVAAAFPEVRLVALDRNLGFPAACNRGVAACSGGVVVLLNNDVEVRPEFLEQLVRPLRQDPRAGSAAALLIDAGEQTIDSVGLTVDRTLAGFPRLRGRPLGEAASPRPLLAGPSGGAGAYRRAAWEAVGGLDEGVVGYGEDVDLALRLRAAGWIAAAAPGAVGVHLGSSSFGRRSAWQRYHGGFARGYFLRRYRVLRGAAGAQMVATEVLVAAGDALLARDLAALRGRVAGWRAAAACAPLPPPPADALDGSIGFRESLRLRRVVYGARPGPDTPR